MYPIIVKELLQYGVIENSEKFEYVDVDLQIDRATYSNICSLPCVQIEDDNGDVLERHTGMMNVGDIRKVCKKVGKGI
jgi:hypothetical protein